jgi:histidinol-phosphate phosphatase family protein
MPALFLDRDGVINRRLPGEYVQTPETFFPVEGLGEAIRLLSTVFHPIVVVTNQQGIGKGLMGEVELANVHYKMHQLVTAAGGHIDRVYHCPHLREAACACRKPATGMAWMALQDFPDMVFDDSWMVGDSASDMLFAERLGLRKVLIRGNLDELDALAKVKVDFAFDSLLEFAVFMTR